MTDEHFILTIVIARPGSRQQSLCVLIHTLTDINMVLALDNYLDTLRLISLIEKKNITILVLIDSPRLNGSTEIGVKLIKEKSPTTRCILLAEQPKFEEIYKAYGADAVLVDNFSAVQFLAVVQDWLPDPNAPAI